MNKIELFKTVLQEDWYDDRPAPKKIIAPERNWIYRWEDEYRELKPRKITAPNGQEYNMEIWVGHVECFKPQEFDGQEACFFVTFYGEGPKGAKRLGSRYANSYGELLDVETSLSSHASGERRDWEATTKEGDEVFDFVDE